MPVSSERRLLSEVTVLARHLHWPLGELLDLEHSQRRWFVAEVERQIAEEAGSSW